MQSNAIEPMPIIKPEPDPREPLDVAAANERYMAQAQALDASMDAAFWAAA